MASQPVPNHQKELGSPYCADPNCEYCKNLREAQERLKQDRAKNKVERGRAAKVLQARTDAAIAAARATKSCSFALGGELVIRCGFGAYTFVAMVDNRF